MAVIKKIREKYAKVAGFAVGLALVGFILMDAGSGGLSEIFGRDTSVASVDGDKIDYQDYTLRVQEYEALYELLSNNPIDENTRAQIRQQVLQGMIYEKLIQDDIEDLGLQITENEEKNMITGANPDPLVLQFPYFRNPETGQFDPQALMQFETNQLDLSQPVAQRAMEQWQLMKNYIKRNRLTQKYDALFTQAVYVPAFVTDRRAKDESFVASIDYVKIPFTAIADAEVKVTEEDLKKYIKAHSANYRIEEPSRTIEYISFSMAPSSADTTAVLTRLDRLKQEFETTTDPETFVNRNSETPFTGQYVFKNTFMSRYSDSIFQAQEGIILGPYFENGSYKMVKILDKRQMPDSAHAHHILIAPGQMRSDEQAKQLADSLLLALKSGAIFDSVAVHFSDDQGSRATGGDLGSFSYGMMVPEFNDAVFNGQPGELKLVKTQFGYHIVRIDNLMNYQPAAKLAIVSSTLEPGSETINAAYARANEFAGRNATAEAFDEAVTGQSLNKMEAQNIKANDFIIPGLGSAHDVIRWMYQAKEGEISPVFTVGDRYIVAKLSEINKEGLAPITEANRASIEALVKTEKKAELIAAKYKSEKSLQTIAAAAQQPVEVVDSFTAANPFVGQIGYQPKVVGYSFYEGLKLNERSPAIPAQDGVFYISLKSRQQNPVSVSPVSGSRSQMLEMQLKSNLSNGLIMNMKNEADIEYNVENLY